MLSLRANNVYTTKALAYCGGRMHRCALFARCSGSPALEAFKIHLLATLLKGEPPASFPGVCCV